MKNGKWSRREFMNGLGKGVLAASLFTPVFGAGSRAVAKQAPMTMEPITLDLTKEGFAALTKPGGAVKIPNPLDKKKPIVVSRLSETGVAAFSSKCPHFGCEVALPVNGVITCPCHKATFDASGNVTKGPAKKNLYQFDATLKESVVTITEKPAQTPGKK